LNTLSQIAFSQWSYRRSSAQQPTVPLPHAFLDIDGKAQKSRAAASIRAGDSSKLP
jgi:hypothetical protein